jgi:hypothetical protein
VRTLNRVLAAVLALVLLVVGVLIALQIILSGLRFDVSLIPYQQWFRTARSREWNDIEVFRVMALLCVTGLALVALQLVRRRPLSLPLRPGAEGVDAEVSRSSLEKTLARAAVRVDGVSGAKSRVSRGNVKVWATTNRQAPRDLDHRVQESVQERVERLQLATSPTVNVRVTNVGRT